MTEGGRPYKEVNRELLADWVGAGGNPALVGFLGDSVVGDDVSIESGGIAPDAFLGVIVDTDQAKAWLLTLCPLPVVHHAPVVVALDWQPGVNNLFQVVIDV